MSLSERVVSRDDLNQGCSEMSEPPVGAQEDPRTLHHQLEVKALNNRLNQVKDDHALAVKALLKCQGLLSAFNRPDVRKAFLDKKFVSLGNLHSILASLDIIKEIVLPDPFLSAGQSFVETDALDFITKLLSKDRGEPKDGLGNVLPHRQSLSLIHI